MDNRKSGDFEKADRPPSEECSTSLRPSHHELLANSYFDVTKPQLQFNIGCGLKSPSVSDKDVQDLVEDRLRKHISPTLSCTCRYWAKHLQESIYSEAVRVHENLDNFLRSFWMEVLNLDQRILTEADILREVQNGLKDSLMKPIADAASSFMSRFAGGACTRSTPHIYASAAPFCPKSSSVYDNYWGYMRGLMEVEGHSAMKEWQSAAIIVRETDASVSVAFSPDGTRIVSGSDDKTIRVWDARNGDLAGPFEGHTDYVQSVAFSPDGTRIVSGSNDKTIRVRDARSGDVVAGPFEFFSQQ